MDDERAGGILRQGKWLIVVSLVFSVAVAVLATELQTKVYEASVLVRVPSAALARADAVVIGDRGFLGEIRRQVQRGAYTADELADRVSARPVDGTTLVRVRAEESSPTVALALVRDVGAAFVRSTDGASLVAPASASRSAIRPKTFQNVLAGIALGLLLGVLLSRLRVRLDRALRETGEVEPLTGARVLAEVPLRKRPLPDDPLLEETFDALFAGLDPQLRVLTIAGAGSEARTTAAALAEAAGRAGVRALVADDSARTRDLLDELRGRHSLVVVDGPALVAASDAVLLVALIGVTSRADLRSAAATLRETGTPVLGAVVYRPLVRADLLAAAPADGPAPSYDSLVRD
jgi:hypothetical protein